jgi:basic membrane lipoprotein Med (substrate-binding protein (PBP1-ABC) superfamily)
VLVRTGRVRIWLATGAVVIAAAAVAWGVWPSSAPAPQARRYLDASACLLTGPSGIAAGTPGAPVWAAMQSASLATHVMVSYLSDTGPADVGPMLNTLIERQCGVIVATSEAIADVLAAGKANPHQEFLLIDEPGAISIAGTTNTTVVSQADASDRIDQVIRTLAANAPPPGS